MNGRYTRLALLGALAAAWGIAAGCARPLGIVREATEGVESLTSRVEDSFQTTRDKVDAFGDNQLQPESDAGPLGAGGDPRLPVHYDGFD